MTSANAGSSVLLEDHERGDDRRPASIIVANWRKTRSGAAFTFFWRPNRPVTPCFASGTLLGRREQAISAQGVAGGGRVDGLDLTGGGETLGIDGAVGEGRHRIPLSEVGAELEHSDGGSLGDRSQAPVEEL